MNVEEIKRLRELLASIREGEPVVLDRDLISALLDAAEENARLSRALLVIGRELDELSLLHLARKVHAALDGDPS